MDEYLLRQFKSEDFRFYNPMAEAIKKLSEDIWSKKEELIKKKLTEKGFGHLIAGIEKRIFPKIARVEHDGWELYFADNDTDEGCFIIGFKTTETLKEITDTNDFRINATHTFQYTDTFPLVSFR